MLDGTADPGTLGVSAIGELTLVFRLSERDDTFLSKLTLPGAMPCDEAFFESTRGTYGLSSASTLSSGSFTSTTGRPAACSCTAVPRPRW